MFDRSIHLLTLIVYAALVGILLVYLQASSWLFVLAFSLVPMLLPWRQSRGMNRVLIRFILPATLVAVALEGFVYLQTSLLAVPAYQVELFGVVPVESFAITLIYFLYLTAVYEYVFDDQMVSRIKLTNSVRLILGVAAILLYLSFAYLCVYSGFVVATSFSYLLFGLAFLLMIGVVSVHYKWLQVLIKAATFSLLTLPLSVVYEYATLANHWRFLADKSEYVYSFNLAGQFMPLADLLFVVLVPFWLVLIYELYLDDGK